MFLTRLNRSDPDPDIHDQTAIPVGTEVFIHYAEMLPSDVSSSPAANYYISSSFTLCSLIYFVHLIYPYVVFIRNPSFRGSSTH